MNHVETTCMNAVKSLEECIDAQLNVARTQVEQINAENAKPLDPKGPFEILIDVVHVPLRQEYETFYGDTKQRWEKDTDVWYDLQQIELSEITPFDILPLYRRLLVDKTLRSIPSLESYDIQRNTASLPVIYDCVERRFDEYVSYLKDKEGRLKNARSRSDLLIAAGAFFVTASVYVAPAIEVLSIGTLAAGLATVVGGVLYPSGKKRKEPYLLGNNRDDQIKLLTSGDYVSGGSE